MNALHSACQAGNLSEVEALLSSGAVKLEERSATHFARTALLFAAEAGSGAIVDHLLRDGADVEAKDDAGLSALHFACCAGNAAMAARLLAAGADTNARMVIGWTALMIAAMRGQQSVVGLLLCAGAEPNAVTRNGETALHFASSGGHTLVVALLIAAGAIADPISLSGQTPLILASQRGHEAVAALLLTAGANPNSRDDMRRTPLGLATWLGHVATTAHLIAAGADLDLALGVGPVAAKPATTLVAAGYRNWKVVPYNCTGLEASFFAVWWASPAEMPDLFSRLEDGVKAKARATLLSLERSFPTMQQEHRMRILHEALTFSSCP